MRAERLCAPVFIVITYNPDSRPEVSIPISGPSAGPQAISLSSVSVSVHVEPVSCPASTCTMAPARIRHGVACIGLLYSGSVATDRSGLPDGAPEAVAMAVINMAAVVIIALDLCIAG